MTNGLRVEVLSPEGSICSMTATQVTLPTTSGEITVLPGHVPLFTRLAEGEIIITSNAETTYVGITGGFLELAHDAVTILADYAVKSDTVIAARAEEAKRKAEEAMREKKDTAGFVVAEQDFKKSILELKVSDRVKRRARSKT
jgi:F-type H+-transporting ATPase subunit epsilon